MSEFRLLGAAPRSPAAAGERVRAWALEAFSPDPARQTLTVSELRCREEGCPPRETVIAILEPGVAPVRHTIHLPLAEVTRERVMALARRPKGA